LQLESTCGYRPWTSVEPWCGDTTRTTSAGRAVGLEAGLVGAIDEDPGAVVAGADGPPLPVHADATTSTTTAGRDAIRRASTVRR
jgi:hypothetical protein